MQIARAADVTWHARAAFLVPLLTSPTDADVALAGAVGDSSAAVLSDDARWITNGSLVTGSPVVVGVKPQPAQAHSGPASAVLNRLAAVLFRFAGPVTNFAAQAEGVVFAGAVTYPTRALSFVADALGDSLAAVFIYYARAVSELSSRAGSDVIGVKTRLAGALFFHACAVVHGLAAVRVSFAPVPDLACQS